MRPDKSTSLAEVVKNLAVIVFHFKASCGCEKVGPSIKREVGSFL